MLKQIPTHLKLVLVAILLFLVYSGGKKVYNASTSMFNQTTEIKLQYEQVAQQQITNYDAYYQAFIDKNTNAKINKDAFIEVTNIIMTNRKDGENLSWKWLQENQQIDYSEFTSFYKEISALISERYADNAKIEAEKQQLVRQHNALLKTYPNNILNKVIHIEDLEYQQGYVSELTKLKFGKTQPVTIDSSKADSAQ